MRHDVDELAGRHAGEDALVIGNSPWRAGFPLAAWNGPTIGCNALYREFTPDYLCCLDIPIMDDIVRSDLNGTKLICGNNQPRINARHKAECHWWVAHRRRHKFGPSSGTFGLWLAGHLGCESATLVGFNCSRANIYAGTDHYKNRKLDDVLETAQLDDLETALERFPGQSFMVTPPAWTVEKLRCQ